MKIFTQQQEEIIIKEMGYIRGRFYMNWFEDNVNRIITEWFYGDDFTSEDIDRDEIGITKKIHDEWVEWSKENLN